MVDVMQQVNLYLPEFRPRKDWLTASSIVGAAAFVFILMVFYIVTLKNAVEEIKSNVAVLEQQKETIQSRVEQIKNIPRAALSESLDSKIESLNYGIRKRQEVSLIIKKQNLGNAYGFSSMMESLARKYSPEISLSHIRVSRGGKFVEFSGATRVADAVPEYIRNLQNEESFLNVGFGLVSIHKAKEFSRDHTFSVGFEPVYSQVKEEGD